MFTNSTGRRIRRAWRTSRLIRRARTTGGWQSSIPRRSIAEPKAVLAPAEVAGPLHGLQIAVPRWSPDGKTIAFIGGLMSDQGSTGGDVWIVSAEGGAPRDLTEGRPTSPAWIEWGSNDYLFVSELAGGNSQLIRYKLSGDRVGNGPVTFGSPIFSIPGSVGDGRLEMSLSSTSDRSMFVFGASNFDHPREIYAAKPGDGNDLGSRRRDAAFAFQRRRTAGMGQGRVAELEERWIPRAGLAAAAQGLRSGQEVPADRGGARGSGRSGCGALGRWRRA